VSPAEKTLTLPEGATLTAVYDRYTVWVRGERKGVSANVVDRDVGTLFGKWDLTSQSTTAEEAKQVLLEELHRRIGDATISLDWRYNVPLPPATS
jgi:hypothetical protein